MKFLTIIILSVFAFPTFAASSKISEEIAVLVATAYAQGLPAKITDYVETTIEEELANPWYSDSYGYQFVMYDMSGDCGFVISVNFDGSINKDQTYTDWVCE